MDLSVAALEAVLATVVDPDRQKPLTTLGWIRDLAITGTHVTLTLAFPSGEPLQREFLDREVQRILLAVKDVATVKLTWRELSTFKNIIVVMSGKGGVGKSTVATNLTLALHRAGHRVGLLDADIYGPSIPTMLGVMGRPVSLDGVQIEPLERFGVKLMSIGFLLEDPRSAVIWRGPMLAGALQQFLKDVHWGTLDYLVLDLPPGTGDVALTLSQQVKVTGAVIVTTPQPVATDDVFKSVAMCQKVNIPVLGVVENMSFFVDSAGVRHELFGSGGGAAVASFANAPLLGQVPMEQSIRECGDKGTPIVQAAPSSAAAQVFAAIAERLVEQITGVEPAAAPVIDRSGGTGKRRLPLVS